MTQRYKAITPNKEYCGKTCGVRFENGVAYFDDLILNPEIGLSADEIARKLQDEFGYTVTTIEGKPIGKPEPVAAKQAETAATKTTAIGLTK